MHILSKAYHDTLSKDLLTTRVREDAIFCFLFVISPFGTAERNVTIYLVPRSGISILRRMLGTRGCVIEVIFFVKTLGGWQL